jgi:hypothetical protein
MREKKSGALQKLKKRLSHSFGRLCKLIFIGNEHSFNFMQNYNKTKTKKTL